MLFKFFFIVKCKLFCWELSIFVGNLGLVWFIKLFICCKVRFVVVSLIGLILMLIFFCGVLYICISLVLLMFCSLFVSFWVKCVVSVIGVFLKWFVCIDSNKVNVVVLCFLLKIGVIVFLGNDLVVVLMVLWILLNSCLLFELFI